jgi:hypothetical protein
VKLDTVDELTEIAEQLLSDMQREISDEESRAHPRNIIIDLDSSLGKELCLPLVLDAFRKIEEQHAKRPR